MFIHVDKTFYKTSSLSILSSYFCFYLGWYNGKFFKCETFIKISSKQMGQSKTVHSFKTTSIVKREL